ncbi:MAG: chromate efflux transporter [Pseudomonas sp.]
MTIDDNSEPKPASRWVLFLIFLRLGLTSFGGPVAHLSYFREEFVTRRRWLDESGYADLVALCQFLPGPASSQVGLAIGLLRGGFPGALAAWAGFTLPSALALTLFGLGISSWGETLPAGILQGLKIVAVAIVAHAVWGMARNLCTDRLRIAMALAAATAVLLLPAVWTQLAVILFAGLLGRVLIHPTATQPASPTGSPVDRRLGLILLGLFFMLLIALPALAKASSSQVLALIDAFYRAGSLVFGGGHVVLPLLQAEVASSGWVSNDSFLAGYGAAQAVPGPLFTFAAFLGASMQGAPSGWTGALICLVAIFAPSFLLVSGFLPFWESLRSNQSMRAALAGVNAAVVGLLLAALCGPVWTHAIFSLVDFAVALLALMALAAWKWPVWLVVVGGSAAGWALTLL